MILMDVCPQQVKMFAVKEEPFVCCPFEPTDTENGFFPVGHFIPLLNRCHRFIKVRTIRMPESRVGDTCRILSVYSGTAGFKRFFCFCFWNNFTLGWNDLCPDRKLLRTGMIISYFCLCPKRGRRFRHFRCCDERSAPGDMQRIRYM